DLFELYATRSDGLNRLWIVGAVGPQSTAGATGDKTAEFSASVVSIGHLVVIDPFIDDSVTVDFDVRWSVEALEDAPPPEYTILLRDWRTLALKGELPDYQMVS